jgi:hypothetical protein
MMSSLATYHTLGEIELKKLATTLRRQLASSDLTLNDAPIKLIRFLERTQL